MIALSLVAFGAATVALGYALQRAQPDVAWRVLAWTLLLIALSVTHSQLADASGPTRLLAFLVVLFYGIKQLVGVESRLAGTNALPLRHWLAFAIAWPGMNPGEFLRPRTNHAAPALRSALVPIAVGVGLLYLATRLHAAQPDVAAFVFVAGFVAVLHLGGFALLTILFCRLGYAVRCPFRAPWRSATLHEFWAKRWNTGFSFLTQLAIYRPLAKRFGRGLATFAGFVFSGLIHEVACSLPAGGGYGLPTLYFLLHGAAVALEQYAGVPRSRVWTLTWVLLPVPLLFHGPLRESVVLPLLS